MESLILQARQILSENKDVEQVLVVKTAAGRTHSFINCGIRSGNHRDEDAFLQKLAKWNDTEVVSLLCAWENGGFDLPFIHFRRGLLELNPENENAEILVFGKGKTIIKKLKDTLTKPQTPAE